mmetsp:Transcript_135319/g.306138  ORF Transcript_135319/g.306138 Transcript_135319/m.306138 type:complete len:419 (+) Transcript_135319:630-1886(+)
MVPRVRDGHVRATVLRMHQRDSGGVVQMAIAKLANVVPGPGVEHLHSVIPRVAHVQVSLAVDTDALWSQQAAVKIHEVVPGIPQHHHLGLRRPLEAQDQHRMAVEVGHSQTVLAAVCSGQAVGQVAQVGQTPGARAMLGEYAGINRPPRPRPHSIHGDGLQHRPFSREPSELTVPRVADHNVPALRVGGVEIHRVTLGWDNLHSGRPVEGHPQSVLQHQLVQVALRISRVHHHGGRQILRAGCLGNRDVGSVCWTTSDQSCQRRSVSQGPHCWLANVHSDGVQEPRHGGNSSVHLQFFKSLSQSVLGRKQVSQVDMGPTFFVPRHGSHRSRNLSGQLLPRSYVIYALAKFSPGGAQWDQGLVHAVGHLLDEVFNFPIQAVDVLFVGVTDLLNQFLLLGCALLNFGLRLRQLVLQRSQR